MWIALVAPLATPVRAKGSGSIEHLVWVLGRELVALGHEVTTFACAGSDVTGELVVTMPGPYGVGGTPQDWQLADTAGLARAVQESHRFDVVHSHAYLFGVPLEPLAKAPLVHTLHVMPSEDSLRVLALRPRPIVTGLSSFQWAALPAAPIAAVVHHGLDPSSFPFRAAADGYLCYLGRFTPGKGPLTAIAAAREVGIPLLLAGPANDYFHAVVAPHVDGRDVEYVGTVDGVERGELLGGAGALLYPLEEPEPFGLVLIEAMLCGTPAVAPSSGAIAEIVDHGISGVLTGDGAAIADAIPAAAELDRAEVRARTVERFSAREMASRYVDVYEAAATARSPVTPVRAP